MTFYVSGPGGGRLPYDSPDWRTVEAKGNVGDESSQHDEPPPEERGTEQEEAVVPLPVALATEVMQHNVVTISDEATLEDVMDIMAARNIRQIPVIAGNGRLVGLISERQVLNELRRETKEKKPIKVKDVMTERVLCANPIAGIREIAHIFFDESIHSLPIVDDNDHVVGIITRSDVLNTVMKIDRIKHIETKKPL